MAFTFPNGQVATYAAQAQWMQVDVDILAAGDAGTGVAFGCGVTQPVSGMSVVVAAGGVTSQGAPQVAVAAVAALTISAAHASNPRIDLIKVTPAGVVSVVAGTAAVAAVLQAPAIPAGDIGLALVYVPATVTSIVTNMITDKRVIMARKPVGARNFANMSFR